MSLERILCVGTIKRNDLRTSLKAKELISNARSIKDLGAKTKEQEEEGDGEGTRPREKTSLQKLIHLMNVLGYL